MKTLGSPFAKIVLDRNNGERGGFHSRREANITTNHKQELSFWPSKKLVNAGFWRLVTPKFKGICPVSASSSSSYSSSSSTPSQMKVETIETQNQETYQSKRTVHVKFLLQKECSFGEQFMIVGDDPMFGLWDPKSAIPLNWSDGHVWTVELDMPTGKSIQYKFILKGIAGTILWQPGPDRILKTWKTDKNVVVCEDWKNAALQKIMEEDPLTSQDESGPAITSGMLIDADILTHQGEDFASELDNGTVIPNAIPHLEKQSMSMTQQKQLVADNIAHSQEEPEALVADNVSYLKEDPTVNTQTEVLGENRMNRPTEAKSLPTLNHTAKEGENFLGTNGRVPTIKNSPGTVFQENLISHEGEPVLVPGLPPLSVVQSETTNLDGGERSMAFDASLGVKEVKNHNLPESEEKHETKNDQHQVGKNEELNNKQQFHVEPKHNPTAEDRMPHEPEPVDSSILDNDIHPVAEDRMPHEPEPVDSSILDNDVQWGRKTLQKLLTNLGLL